MSDTPTTTPDELLFPLLPYQVERIEVGDNGLTVTFATKEDLANPHVIQFRHLVINTHDDLYPLMVQLLRQACELIDEALTVQRQPPATRPPRLRTP